MRDEDGAKRQQVQVSGGRKRPGQRDEHDGTVLAESTQHTPTVTGDAQERCGSEPGQAGTVT
jgi:hypothetical protein